MIKSFTLSISFTALALMQGCSSATTTTTTPPGGYGSTGGGATHNPNTPCGGGTGGTGGMGQNPNGGAQDPNGAHNPNTPQACSVDARRELMLTDLTVVEDPERTGDITRPTDGAWTFGRLIAGVAGDQDPSDFVSHFFGHWIADQTVNGFTVPARADGVMRNVLNIWPRTADGKLDMLRAPFRLEAIVNRLDLRDAQRPTGETRFVFELITPQGDALLFGLILEYAASGDTALAWAQKWHSLGSLPLDGNAFNAQLQAITDEVTAPHANPGAPNGSGILRVRTNEFELTDDNTWQLRQFELSQAGQLEEVPTPLTPDLSFNQSSALAAFINANQNDILAARYSVPAALNGAPFLAGAIVNNPLVLLPNPIPPIWRQQGLTADQVPARVSEWVAPGVVSNDARCIVSLNTCSGCHGGETTTNFLHVGSRAAGLEAPLSQFLTGETVTDPADPNTLRTYGELQRRAEDLSNILCRGAGTQQGEGAIVVPR